ncbi:MAG: ribosomal RNA small subunit methyltransferase A [Dehalococcoidia bacterium]|nr:ribosomal RNA small subunit methyltransferase A [Dehalococcoidia bacterium]
MRSRSSRNARGSRPRPKKRFGQHFLSDRNILGRIADAADPGRDDVVVEVGPGLGALTAVLAARVGRVIAVEVDRDLVPTLRGEFAGAAGVTIVEGDVLGWTPDELLRRGDARPPYLLVGNLPYNIAAAVLRHFLEARQPPLRIVAMVQLEVAEAIVAAAGKMSLLSVATQVYGEPRIVMRVAPGAFSPPPAVQSAVVRIDVARAPRVDAPLDAFFRIVRAGFGNPRKQLRNSLSFGMHVKQSVVDEVMQAAGIDVTLRPQVLSLDDWATLTRAWVEGMRR